MKKIIYLRYFFMFYLFFVILFLLYYLNFFLFPKSGFSLNIYKIFYVMASSLFFSFYMTIFIISQKRTAKILFFLGFILALFYLQDYKRNFILTYTIEENVDLYKIIEDLSACFSFIFLILASFFQFKTNDKNIKKVETNKKNNEELFV